MTILAMISNRKRKKEQEGMRGEAARHGAFSSSVPRSGRVWPVPLCLIASKTPELHARNGRALPPGRIAVRRGETVPIWAKLSLFFGGWSGTASRPGPPGHFAARPGHRVPVAWSTPEAAAHSAPCRHRGRPGTISWVFASKSTVTVVPSLKVVAPPASAVEEFVNCSSF